MLRRRNWLESLFTNPSPAKRLRRKERERFHQSLQRKEFRFQKLEPRVVMSHGLSADFGQRDPIHDPPAAPPQAAPISGEVGFDGLQTGVWHEIENTDLQSLAPANDDNYSWNDLFSGFDNARGDGGILAWSGGAFDSQRNRLLVWGGGHNDYSGNGVYAFDVDTLSWERVTLPSLPNQNPSQAAIDAGVPCALNQSWTCLSADVNPDQTPASRHTYDSINYLPGSDRLFGTGGSRWADGAISSLTWTLDLEQTNGQATGDGAWIQGSQDLPEPNWSYGFYSAYDPASESVYFSGANHLLNYDPSSEEWSIVTADGSPVDVEITPIDQHVAEIGYDPDTPQDHKMVVIGGGVAYYFDLSDSNNITRHELVTTGDNSIIDATAPGLEYNEETGTFFAWGGGADLFELDLHDPANATWTKHTIDAGSESNIPPAQVSTGTFGRFQYIQSENAFVLANGAKENVFVYKHGVGSTDPTDPDPSDPTTDPAPLPILEILEVRDADGDGTNDSIDHVHELVQASVPLQQGSGITHVNQLALEGVSDAQFRVLSRYEGSLDDASKEIRWVEVDFLANLDANQTHQGVQLLKLDSPATISTLAQQTENTVTIDTGAGQFVVDGSNGALLSSADVGGVQQLSEPMIAYAIASGQEYTSLNDNAQVTIEENGPVTSVVKVDGRLTNGTEGHLWYTARLHFVKDNSEVKTELTFRNADQSLLADQNFDAYGVRFNMINVNPAVTFVTEDGQSFQGNLSGSQTALAYQGFNDNHPFNQHFQAFELQGCGDYRRSDNFGLGWTTSPVAGTCNESTGVYEYDPTNKGTLIVIAGTTPLSGGNTQSVSYARVQSSGQSITLAQRLMANYYPASFEIGGNGQVDIGLHSKHSGKPDQTFNWGGHATREFTVAFDSTDSAKVRRNLDFPLVARAQGVEHYRNANALLGEGGITSNAEQADFFSRHGEPDEKTIGNQRVLDRPPLFGVIRTTSWRRFYRDYTRDVIDFWRADADNAALYYFRVQEKAKFDLDNGVGHSDGFDLAEKPASFLQNVGLSNQRKAFNSFDGSHQETRYLPLAYYLTGNERIQQGIIEYGEEQYFDDVQASHFNLSRLFESPREQFNADIRGWYRRLQNYAWLWQFTGDERYLSRMMEGVDKMLTTNAKTDPGGRGQDPERGFLYAGGIRFNANGQEWFQSNDGPFDRITHPFFDTLIAGGTWAEVLRVLRQGTVGTDGFTSSLEEKVEDIEDLVLGQANYVFRELLKDSDRLEENFSIDSSNVFASPGATYTAARLAVHIYDMFGDSLVDGVDVFAKDAKLHIDYMKVNESLVWTENWMSDPMRQALVYADQLDPASLHGYKEITGVSATYNSSDDTYTLSWTVPQDITGGYRIKAAQGKQIVDWLGFDRITRQFANDPASNVPWFAAQNLKAEPDPGDVETTQTWTVPADQLGGTGWNFSVMYETGQGSTTGTVTPALSVVIAAASINENGGTTTATVTRNTDTTNALTVTLISDDTGEATVPVSVTIAAGEVSSASLTITGAPDGLVDGTQTVTLTASANGHSDGTDDAGRRG